MSDMTPEQIANGLSTLWKEMQKRGVVLTGGADPRDGAGLFAPVGAEYVQTALGIQIKRFQKFGPGNEDWAETLSSGSGSGITPVLVSSSTTVEPTWYGRPIHVTSAAVITLPVTTYAPPDGFMFICIIETLGSVSFEREDNVPGISGLISTILGELDVVGNSYPNAAIAFSYRAGKWFAIGQILDLS